MNKQRVQEILQSILNYYSMKLEVSQKSDDLSLRVLMAIKKHKLEGRVNIVELMKLEKAEYLSTHFVASIMFAKNTLNEIFEKHLHAVQEIIQEFKIQGIKELPIVVKGFSIYGLTNNINNLRRSVDIDLIHPSPPILEGVLSNLGYQNDYRFSEHEYCGMSKGDVAIEIHNYIPIIDYSKDIEKKAKLAQLNNQNIFFEFHNLEKGQIQYSDLIQEAQTCSHMGGLLIPDVHYQILIISTHLFRNFINSQFHFSSHIIIAELLDILDLLNHPSFNKKYFQKIILNYKCLSSIRFVANLLGSILSEYQLIKILTDIEDACSNRIDQQLIFPKILQWSGAMYIPKKKEEYIYGGINEFIDNIDTLGTIIFENNVEVEIPNLHKFNSHGIQTIKRVSATLNKDVIIFTIKPMDLMMGLTCDVFEIFLEDKRCCFIVEDLVLREEEIPDGVKCTLTDKVSYTVIVEIPVRLLDVYGRSEYGLVLSITRWGTGPLTTFIPIKIIQDKGFHRLRSIGTEISDSK